MKPRMPSYQVAPEAYRTLSRVEEYLETSSLPPTLMHLVKRRASQINGCAYCIDMHWKDLRALGEPEQRLYALDAWRESPWYSDQERAALEWTEQVTRISETHAEEDAYARVKQQFSDKEMVDLTLLIATINAWNRMAISFRAEPGKYRSPLRPASEPAELGVGA